MGAVFADSQLNQEQIIDGQKKLRGEGFELRTDEHGVIRVAKGLFISADGQQKSVGSVLEMHKVLGEIDLCRQQLEQLNITAGQAQALRADICRQLEMFSQRLQAVNKTLLFSASSSMALTSGEHMQLAASQNVAIQTRGGVSLGVMRHFTALAGEKLGLFARTGTLSLKASEGAIEMQAQNVNLRLFAENTLNISSDNAMGCCGKKRIRLMGEVAT